ncbi:hypothetical protein CK203_067465 [Vitis vinifera]|uniref:Uncharacterized protein n=1 Tax=Vitis vinifera TaxID=29760 RepID=A0A438EBB8_VITVI|nr:hypothetical protein CK203_067465 [Vitis vinifera]
MRNSSKVKTEQLDSLNLLSENFKSVKTKPSTPNLGTVSQGDAKLPPMGVFKTEEQICHRYLRYVGVGLEETKREVCDRRFVGSVWSIRNKEWAALPTCGASGGILIIWDSKKMKQRGSDGDCNSKFFHKVANGRRNRNFIKFLENERGLVLDNSKSITEEILLYFKKLYSSPPGKSWRVEGVD